MAMENTQAERRLRAKGVETMKNFFKEHKSTVLPIVAASVAIVLGCGGLAVAANNPFGANQTQQPAQEQAAQGQADAAAAKAAEQEKADAAAKAKAEKKAAAEKAAEEFAKGGKTYTVGDDKYLYKDGKVYEWDDGKWQLEKDKVIKDGKVYDVEDNTYEEIGRAHV